ncbi:Alkali-sensitive linkage protein [Pleurotus pulmonarius]
MVQFTRCLLAAAAFCAIPSTLAGRTMKRVPNRKHTDINLVLNTTVHASPAKANTASSLTPNGIKAGLSAGDAFAQLKDHIGWWYDWSPMPRKAGSPIGVPMLWGDGTADAQDAKRYAQFQKLPSPPPYVLGFEEPDCEGNGSAGMSVDNGVYQWEKMIAPLKASGTKLGSPAMCKQADETWLAQFNKKVKTPWDFTAIHINKDNMDGVRKDLDHYWNTYKKPIWVTEFACVNDHNTFTPCTDQGKINTFINQIVDLLQNDSRVVAYAYSNGLGLGNVWPMWRNGRLSPSGQTYLNAIRKYH